LGYFNEALAEINNKVPMPKHLITMFSNLRFANTPDAECVQIMSKLIHTHFASAQKQYDIRQFLRENFQRKTPTIQNDIIFATCGEIKDVPALVRNTLKRFFFKEVQVFIGEYVSEEGKVLGVTILDCKRGIMGMPELYEKIKALDPNFENLEKKHLDSRGLVLYVSATELIKLENVARLAMETIHIATEEEIVVPIEEELVA